MVQTVKHLLAIRETWVQSLGWEDPLEKGMATHSSILAWRIPWKEEPGRLQSTGSQRVRHDWVTSLCLRKMRNCELQTEGTIGRLKILNSAMYSTYVTWSKLSHVIVVCPNFNTGLGHPHDRGEVWKIETILYLAQFISANLESLLCACVREWRINRPQVLSTGGRRSPLTATRQHCRATIPVISRSHHSSPRPPRPPAAKHKAHGHRHAGQSSREQHPVCEGVSFIQT